MLDRRGETEDFIPVADDLFPIYSPADEGRERLISGWLLHGIETRVGKVANTWGEPKTKQMTQGEDVIGESGGVGVMLFDVEGGFVIQQPVEHMGRVTHGCAYELDMEWGVLVRDVSIERRARLVAVAGID